MATKALLVDRSLQRFAALLEERTPDVSWAACDPADHARIRAELRDTEIFVGSRLDETLVQGAPALRMVQVAGAGTDGIALTALPRAVLVANVFEHETSIAEHVLMVMLALSRDLLGADASLRRGVWANPAVETALPLAPVLRGKTVGLVGYGHIGQSVARLAEAFGMDVMAVRRDPTRSADEALAFLGGPDELPTVLAASDFVVVVVPLTDLTRGLVGAEELALMKPTAFLVNVARGPVVEEHALYTALRERTIAGAALDVWYHAPPGPGEAALPSSLPFGELSNVVLTPHYSGVTEDTFRRRAELVADNVNRLLEGTELRSLVANPPQ